MTSVTILAHGAAQATFSRHVKLWDALCPHVTVICPVNDKLSDCPYPVQCVGNACHAGKASIERLKAALGGILKYQDGFHLICEYDSFLLTPSFTKRKGLIGPLQPNYEPCRFIAPRYPNPPWLLDWRTVYLMTEAAHQWPDVWEEGYADRYFAALAVLAGVPILDYDPPGYTRGTIQAEHWYDMEAAIKKGAVAIHGVKDLETLKFVQKVYADKTKQQG